MTHSLMRVIIYSKMLLWLRAIFISKNSLIKLVISTCSHFLLVCLLRRLIRNRRSLLNMMKKDWGVWRNVYKLWVMKICCFLKMVYGLFRFLIHFMEQMITTGEVQYGFQLTTWFFVPVSCTTGMTQHWDRKYELFIKSCEKGWLILLRIHTKILDIYLKITTKDVDIVDFLSMDGLQRLSISLLSNIDYFVIFIYIIDFIEKYQGK